MTEKKIIETMEFDDYACARDCLEQSRAELEKIKEVRKLAAAATFCSFLYLVLIKNDILGPLFFLLALGGSITSYIKGGGIRIAFSVAKKLAFSGWVIIPFPWDIVTGLGALFYSFLTFLFVPIIFVHINYKQYKQYCDDAEAYLQYCKQTTTTIAE